MTMYFIFAVIGLLLLLLPLFFISFIFALCVGHILCGACVFIFSRCSTTTNGWRLFNGCLSCFVCANTPFLHTHTLSLSQLCGTILLDILKTTQHNKTYINNKLIRSTTNVLSFIVLAYNEFWRCPQKIHSHILWSIFAICSKIETQKPRNKLCAI